MLVQAKHAHVQGHNPTTRAEAVIKRAGNVVKRHKQGYKRNWDAMVKLGVKFDGENSPAKGLQELKDDDLRNLRDYMDSSHYSSNAGEIPWIWKTVGTVLPNEASSTEVSLAIRSWEKEGKL